MKHFKYVYFNYEGTNPNQACLVKTNLSLRQITQELASLMLVLNSPAPDFLGRNLSSKTLVRDAGMISFAQHAFINDGASKRVIISKELANFDTGIRLTLAKHRGKRVYLIYLKRIAETHHGTNMSKYEKTGKKLLNNRLDNKGVLEYTINERLRRNQKDGIKDPL